MMTTRIRKAALASALAAMTVGSVTPAMAQGYPYGGGYHRSRGGDTTGAAIIGGIVGIAIGAMIASSGNKHHDRYRDRGWQWRDGYYWDREGRRYDNNGRPCDDDGYAQRNYRGSYGQGDGYYRGGSDRYYDRRGYPDGYGY